MLGLRFYKRPASEKHPFGYGKKHFFWSFIAAIFIFGVGATYAIYEGIEKIRHPHAIENLAWAYWVLRISLVLEAGSIGLVLHQEIKEAHHEGLSFGEYLKESKDLTAKTVIFEDSATLIGIVLAAAGLLLGQYKVAPYEREGCGTASLRSQSGWCWQSSHFLWHSLRVDFYSMKRRPKKTLKKSGRR